MVDDCSDTELVVSGCGFVLVPDLSLWAGAPDLRHVGCQFKSETPSVDGILFLSTSFIEKCILCLFNTSLLLVYDLY